MEKLKDIERCLVKTVQSQLSDLKKVNAKELGEVIDAIKDLEEAMYYCSIIKAMEDSKESETRHYYTPYMEYAPYMMRDKEWRENHLDNEGRSYYSRRMYMENKHNGHDAQKSMQELEYYMRDLGEDLMEMIDKSPVEEKQVLSNKLQQLAQKIMK